MSRVALAAVVLSLIGVVPVAARPTGDFCINTGNGVTPQLIVRVKKFPKPAKDSCKPLTGWEVTGAVPRPVAGTVCMNATGDRLWLACLVHDGVVSQPPNLFFTLPAYRVTMQLPYPSLTGGPVFVGAESGGGTGGLTAFAGPCGFAQPIP